MSVKWKAVALSMFALLVLACKEGETEAPKDQGPAQYEPVGPDRKAGPRAPDDQPAPPQQGPKCGPDCKGEGYTFVVTAKGGLVNEPHVNPPVKIKIYSDENGSASPTIDRTQTPVNKSRFVAATPERKRRDIILTITPEKTMPGVTQCAIYHFGGRNDGGLIDAALIGGQLTEISCVKDKGR